MQVQLFRITLRAESGEYFNVYLEADDQRSAEYAAQVLYGDRVEFITQEWIVTREGMTND